MWIYCSKMFCHQVVYIYLQLQRLIIRIFTGCQHYCRVNFQGDVIGAAGNQYHAHGLRTSAPFYQLRLVALRAVTHSDQRTGFIKQADFTNPPPALIFRDHLLSNNLAAVLRVDIQHIQRCAALLSN
ncbi:hypothetical protein A3097_14460 [Salmonella enterica subsp. enterica serovar Agona]|nr:hypothetical protein [Salmonella enterica subsp. enterica serovar Agona]